VEANSIEVSDQSLVVHQPGCEVDAVALAPDFFKHEEISMGTLTRANRELYRRTPDETFKTLQELHDHCKAEHESSTDVWQLPQTLTPEICDGAVSLSLEQGGVAGLNDWSFTQLCRLAGVSKETLNRFRPETAVSALRDTLPSGKKPIQLLSASNTIRSIHGVMLGKTEFDTVPNSTPVPFGIIESGMSYAVSV
jgi:hypothetical protein